MHKPIFNQNECASPCLGKEYIYLPQLRPVNIFFPMCLSTEGGGGGGVWSRGGLQFFGGVSNFLGGLQFGGGGVNSNYFFQIFLIQIFFNSNYFFKFFFPPKFLLGCTNPPSPPYTLNERPVRILLECIFVPPKFGDFFGSIPKFSLL